MGWFTDADEADAPATENPTWGDYGSAAKAGTQDLGSNVGAMVRYGGERGERGQGVAALGKYLQEYFGDASDETTKGMTPGGRARLEAAITSEDFWRHPVSATMLKGTRMTPTIVAAVIPSLLTSGAFTGAVAAAGTGAALSAAQTVDDLYEQTDKLSDKDLQAQSTFYAGLRSSGMDETEARKEFNKQFMGARPAIAALIGAATNVVGPAGQASRAIQGRGAALTSGAADGIIKRVAKGAAEGAAGETVEEGYQNYAVQDASIEHGLQKQFDYRKLADAALEGGLLGGVFGGAAGIASSHEGAAKGPSQVPASGPKDNVTVVDAGGVSPEQQAAVAANQSASAGQATVAAPSAVPPDIADAASRLNPATQGGVPGRVRQASQRLNGGEEVNAPDNEQGGFDINLPDQLRPTKEDIDASQPETEFPVAPVTPAGNPVVQKIKSRARAPVDTDIARNVPADALDAPADAGVDVPNSERAPKVLKPVGEEEAAPEMVAKIKDLAKQRAEKGSVGSKDTKKLAKRQSDGDLTKQAFDELSADTAIPTTYAERKKLHTRINTIVKGIEGLGIHIPEHTGFDESKNPTPDHLVWARDMKDLADDLLKNPRKKEDRDALNERIVNRLVNWKLAKDTGDFSQMRSDRITEGAQKKSQAKGGNVDQIAVQATQDQAVDAPKKDQIDSIASRDNAAPEETRVGEKDNDAVATAVTKSRVGARIIEGNKFDKDKGEWVVEAAPVKKVAITDELRRQYEQPAAKAPAAEPVTPKGKEAVKAVKAKAAAKKSDKAEVIKKKASDKTKPIKNQDIEAVAKRWADMTEEERAVSEKEWDEKNFNAVKAKEPNLTREEYTARKAAGMAMARAFLKSGGDIKATLKEAAAQVDTNPSDAQKESGNYTKGHVNIQGLDVTLENPQGSKRSGTDPNGAPWEVTMPAHYGYVKRTSGADGDHVDVYVGNKPESPHVFVIDQKDLATGQFDEHKVMLGFDDAVKAMDTYERAFSDGRGLDRVSKITPMSVDEFKTWLAKGDTKAPAAELVAPIAQFDTPPSSGKVGVVSPERIVNQNSISVSRRRVTGDDGREAVAESRTTFEDAFNRWIGKEKKGGFVYEFMARRIHALAKDVPVYVVSDSDMTHLLPPRGRNGVKAAAYAALNSNGDPFIVVSRKILETADRDFVRHALLHEADHAITLKALRTDERIMGAAQIVLNAAREHFDAIYGKENRPYGLSDIYELTAEVRSNPDFRRTLQNVILSEQDEAAFRVLLPQIPAGRIKTLWNAFLEMVRIAINLPSAPVYMRALEGVFEIQAHAEHQFLGGAPLPKLRNEFTNETLADLQRDLKDLLEGPTPKAITWISDDIKRAVVGAAQQEQKSIPKLLSIASWNQVADTADRFFTAVKDGAANPVRKMYELRERRRIRAQDILQSADEITAQSAKLEREFAGAKWEEFTSFLHDETSAGIFADKAIDSKANSHIGKDSLDGAWSREQHADLAARYAKLDPKLKAHREALLKHYSAQQDQAALAIINNRVLTALGIEDKALGQRIFDGTETEADIALINDKAGKTAFNAIKQAGVLNKLQGAYYPQARFGGYVVQGYYKITPPGNGKAIDRNTFEFTDRDAALDFIKKQDARPTVRSVWVDEKTGKTIVEDDDGTEVRVSKQDENAVQRFRVKVQDHHVEFFDTKGEALRAAQEYEFPSDGKPSAFREVLGVEPKRYEPGELHSDMLGGDVVAMKRSLHRGEGYQNFSEGQKRELDRTIDELAIRAMGSNRIQSRRLPRRYVAGASRDATKTLASYNMSMAGYLAKLEYAPQMEAAHKELLEQAKNDVAKDTSMGRRAIANEIEKRLYSDTAFGDRAGTPAALQRLLTVSFIDKLASPAYSLVNATQAAMVGMPVIAGRHGVGAAVSELAKAYRDISGLSVIKHGLGETGKALAAKEHNATYLGDIKARLKGGDLKMIEELQATGQIDGDAGLEVNELTRAQAGNTVSSQVLARADKGLGYIENIARQMPKAIEVMNRATTALAAYRLEMRKSGDHDKAVAYARKVVDQSQFNYSSTNSAPIFNHPLGKLAFQFKKYGQNMYYLIGSNVGKAYRNDTPGARTEALRTLGMIAVTHMAMAGALGLPTEPFKYLLMGAKAAGLKTPGWDDVEEIVRKYAADILGKKGGEIFTRGLPRALGVDVSSRMGLDSLIAFGEPKSDKQTDVKSWLFDTLAGAPTALVSDYIKGANQLTSGNYAKAAELMVPIKFISDGIRAYRTASEGKKSEATGRKLSEPYSYGEAALRTVGFTPAREAEEGAGAAAFRNQTNKARDARSQIINAWVNAKGADKVKAQRDVQKYNSTTSAEMKIESKDLKQASSRREREGTGIVTNKRTAPTKERLDAIYQ